jgi:hypothetical protein
MSKRVGLSFAPSDLFYPYEGRSFDFRPILSRGFGWVLSARSKPRRNCSSHPGLSSMNGGGFSGRFAFGMAGHS